MLIPMLVFEWMRAKDCLPPPYPLRVSVSCRGFRKPIPDLTAPPGRLVSGRGQSGDVLSPQLLRRLSVIYCASIRQQERSCFRHLKLRCPRLKSVAIIALHAYTPPLRAVKTCQPRWVKKRNSIRRFAKIRCFPILDNNLCGI